MSIQDSAYDGTLTKFQLQRHLSSINAIGGAKDLTPLAAACLGGHIDTVELLLENGANPNVQSNNERTPLFYITDPRCKASSATRCAIIRELTSGKRGLKANVDDPCDDDKNTPLMNVIIQLKDKSVIEQLVECGASPTKKHKANQKTAKELAQLHGFSSSLRTKAETDLEWGKLIDLVVSFVLLVISYVNNTVVSKFAEGVAKRYYDISVKETDLPKELPKDFQPKSLGDFKSFLNTEVNQGKFKNFFSPNDPFLENLAEKASKLRDDPTTDLGKPENIKRLTQLSLYHPVIYCDDSGSMEHEHRYESQIELVTRIARIVTKIVPDELAGVDLRFINNTFGLVGNNYVKQVSVEGIQQAMKAVKPNGSTDIGTNLRKKILQPLVYKVIAEANTGNPIPFKRPLLVCIITDGSPGPEHTNVLRDEIVNCKRKLVERGYDPTSVMFCINQIGDSSSAAKFIDGLRNEKEIEDVIYCTVGQLDTKFKELKENERALESWLLYLLARPIMARHDD